MSDIVERLRGNELEGAFWTSKSVADLNHAAADEIERLRAEVARLDEQNGNLRKRLDLIAGWASSMSLIVKGGALPLD